MGPDGNPGFAAAAAAIAYNPQANQYLVVWAGADTTVAEDEIWGQLVDAAGSLLGANFRISDLGPDADLNYRATRPAVTFNSQANEYLVVWAGADNTAPLVAGENEIFGQRLTPAGAEIGANDFRISDMGPNGNINFDAGTPDLTYNPQANEYLVVWRATTTRRPL
jgi:hypothetical protein